jgi:hypothetical protein
MRSVGGPYRVPPRPAREPRPSQSRGAAVIVAVATWMTVAVARSPAVLLGALAITVPIVARRLGP